MGKPSRKTPCINGDEQDAISRRARRLLAVFRNRSGLARAAKRALNRRARRRARTEAREQTTQEQET